MVGPFDPNRRYVRTTNYELLHCRNFLKYLQSKDHIFMRILDLSELQREMATVAILCCGPTKTKFSVQNGEF